jgi:hypothetical protein
LFKLTVWSGDYRLTLDYLGWISKPETSWCGSILLAVQMSYS